MSAGTRAKRPGHLPCHLRDPSTMFLVQKFPMQDKDISSSSPTPSRRKCSSSWTSSTRSPLSASGVSSDVISTRIRSRISSSRCAILGGGAAQRFKDKAPALFLRLGDRKRAHSSCPRFFWSGVDCSRRPSHIRLREGGPAIVYWRSTCLIGRVLLSFREVHSACKRQISQPTSERSPRTVAERI